MRLLRAGIAGWAFWEGFHTGEWILYVLGGIFALQALFNAGCCGSTACYAPPARNERQDDTASVVYEEVK